MKFFKCLFMVSFFLFAIDSFAQLPGLIYKPAGNPLGKSVLDPNGDGFTSASISGFSGTDFSTGSELKMISLPEISMETSHDLATGSGGGHTDIVSNGPGQSCYVLVRNVDGINYLIVRFRLGGNSTAPKGYSLLFDLDGNMNNNYSSKNPGFEREVVLESYNRVAIYSHGAGGATLLQQYDVNNYHQRSVALSTVNNNPDYFYDFFVPLNDIDAPNPIRIVAATITSAQSGIAGTISDFNGINDSNYGGNTNAMFQSIIAGFPPVSLASLSESFIFPNPITSAPVITSNITTASTTISGISQENNGTEITVFQGDTGIGTATVNNNYWTLTGVSGLVAGTVITAKAQAEGKEMSLLSNQMEVTFPNTCYTPAPSIVRRTVTNDNYVDVTYAHPPNSLLGNGNLKITLYTTSFPFTFTTNPTFLKEVTVPYTGGTLVAPILTGITNSNIGTTNFIATVTFNGCTSGFSNADYKTGGNPRNASAPTITTSSILASPTVSRSVTVINNDATACNLILCINGKRTLVSPTTIATNTSHTFNYTGFIDGERITARAQSVTNDVWISTHSNEVIVTSSGSQTTSPVITGVYTAGTDKTVSGTSSEIAGTTISLYKGGTTFLGTATVNLYGLWSKSDLTLVTNDNLTATAKADNKTTSGISNTVNVKAGVPVAPTLNSTIFEGQTSISGTGGQGTITVFVDGSAIGTTTGVSWSLLEINSLEIFKGAVVTATNTVDEIPSTASNSVTVQGVESFCISNPDGSPITSQISGVSFPIKITAMTGPNCSGAVFSGFTGTVTISSSTNMVFGAGQSLNFTAGVLYTTVTLGAPGSNIKLNVVNTNDPTATGTSSFDVIAIATPDQIICLGSTPSDLVLSNTSTSVVKWQKATDTTFTTAIDIPGSASLTTLGGVVTGNISATTYFRAVLNIGGSEVFSNTVAVIVPVSIWNGTTWSNGVPSDLITTALITENYTASEDLTACSMKVSNNAVMVINSGLNITLNGALTVEPGSSVRIKNNSNLIQLTDVANSGNITLERDSAPMFRLDYTMWSSPLVSDNTVLNQNLLSFSPLTLTNRFYTYNTGTNLYNVVDPNTTKFELAKGYLIRTPNNWIPFNSSALNTAQKFTGIFTGVPRNGNVTVTLNNTEDGYNAVGNPYPSALNLEEFINANNGIIEGTLWFWRKFNDHTNPESYYTCNTLACVKADNETVHQFNNGNIPLGQGFVVKVKAGQTNLNFNNSMRTSNNGNQFLRTVSSMDSFKLNLKNAANVIFSQNMIAYIPNATVNYDSGLDGLMMNQSQTAIYTKADDKSLVIQARPVFSVGDIIPLYFKTNSAGAYTLVLSQLSGVFNGNQAVYIRDNEAGILHNLTEGSYTFNTNAGVFNSRFDILYQSTLGNQESTFTSNQVVVYHQNNTLVINSGETQMKSVKIYDVQGRLLSELNNVGFNEIIMNVPAENQMLLVKITDENHRQVTKKVIK